MSQTTPAPATIQALAERGEAPGQCPECRSYRLDGKPPYLHEHGCSLALLPQESAARFVAED